MAREFGANDWGGMQDTPGGGTNGSSADVAPPGIFMVDQFFLRTADFNMGPGSGFNVDRNGNHPQSDIAINAEVFVFNPGWTFLGANTQFIIAQPFVIAFGGSPASPDDKAVSGMGNTFLNAEAAWKFGDWHIKLGLGGWLQTGNINSEPTGRVAPGLPWWTIQPEVVVSWENGPWALTAFTYWEINGKNVETDYQDAPLFHADFSFMYTIGKWTIGPVADFVTQVGQDKTSAFFANSNAAVSGITCVGPATFECAGTSEFWIWAVGALIQYQYGPVTLQFWGTDIVASRASGASLSPAHLNGCGAVACDAFDVTNSGYILWFQLSYALWTPEAPPPPAKAPLIYK